MRSLISFAFIICTSLQADAQDVITALPRWLASAHANLLFPQSPINTFKDDAQVGYQLEFQYRVQYNKPVLVGVFYGESTLSKYSIFYNQSTGAGIIEIKEKANTRRIEPGFTAGFYPEVNWLVQPYFQGRIGVAIFQTSSILTDTDTKETVERISEFTSAAPSYGLDIGFHIVPNIWYIRGDIRIGFYGNTSTTYLLLNDEERDDNTLPIEYFDAHTSAGKWLKVSAGISYLF